MDANGRSLAKAALLTVSADLSHTRTHTIPVIVFFIPEETQETVKYQPVSLKNAAIESFTKCCRADSNHQAEGCRVFLCCFTGHTRGSLQQPSYLISSQSLQGNSSAIRVNVSEHRLVPHIRQTCSKLHLHVHN